MKNIIYSLVFFAMSHTAVATPFNYNSISINYETYRTDVSGITQDMTGDGIGLTACLSVSDNFAINGSYASGSADVSEGNLTYKGDVDVGSIGLLVHNSITPSSDFIAGFDLLKGNIDSSINGSFVGSDDADGNNIYFGIRSMMLPDVELAGKISRSNIESETDTNITFDGALYLNKETSVNAGYTVDSDGYTLIIGAAKYF